MSGGSLLLLFTYKIPSTLQNSVSCACSQETKLFIMSGGDNIEYTSLEHLQEGNNYLCYYILVKEK